MEQPVISVIVPVYKTEQYLPQCLKSIVNQTYKSLEIILVDDGSPDNCGKICDEYAQKDKRIKVLHKTNGGVSSARNLGISTAAGQYVSFVDSDDWVSLDMYQKLADAVRSKKTDLVFCDYYDVTGPYIKRHHDFDLVPENDAQAKEFMIRGILSPSELHISGSCYRILYSRKLLKDYHIMFHEKTRITEDMLFVLQCLKVSDHIAFQNNALYYYRINQDSVTQNYIAGIWNDLMIPIEWAKQNLVYDDPDLSNQIETSIVNSAVVAVSNSCKFGTPLKLRDRIKLCGDLRKLPFVKEGINKTWGNKNSFHKKIWPQIICMRFHFSWLIVWYHSIKNKTLF